MKTPQQILDSFQLKGIISEQHAKDILEILEIALADAQLEQLRKTKEILFPKEDLHCENCGKSVKIGEQGFCADCEQAGARR